MKVLVTGADGFVGEHLIAALLERDREITASTLALPPTRSSLEPEQIAAVDWKAADVRDQEALRRMIAAVLPERIFHLAGFASGALARDQAAVALEINAGGTVNLCEAVLAVQEENADFRPRILVMGSGDAYGDAARAGEPLSETMHLRPINAYGLSKACQELSAHTYRRAHGLRTVAVRGFSQIGVGQRPPFVVPEFCTQVARIAAGQRRPVIEVGNLDVERDFMDVRDGVEAFRRLIELEEARAVYNVASGVPTRIRTILEWILDEAGVDAEIRVDPARVRAEEVPRITGDSTRLAKDTGWAPVHPIEETVRETYRWWAARLAQGEGTVQQSSLPEDV